MTTVINFSGGKTSAYMLKMILDDNNGVLPDDYFVLFQNTGMEAPETLDFVRECGSKWGGVDIHWLEYFRDDDGKVGAKRVNFYTASRNGEPFEDLIFAYKNPYLPNQDHRSCTIELKLRTSKRYMVSLGYKKWNALIGIRADEAHRQSKIKDPRITPHYPLIKANISEADVLTYWKKSNFDLRLKFPGDGNCRGCFLKSEKHRASICSQQPDVAAQWLSWEKRAGATFIKNRSWAELNDFVQRQGAFDFDAEEGPTMPFCDSIIGPCTDF